MLETSNRALVVGDAQPDLASALTAAGVAVERWDRRAFDGREVQASPPAGPFDLVCMRLPQAKPELVMNLHLVAGRLKPEGTLVLFGANDEGIKSSPSRLTPLFSDVKTLATGGHCRVIHSKRDPQHAARGALSDWISLFDPGLEELPSSWVSYPGVFAHGSTDSGTALLLSSLPHELSGLRVLDYGAGTGLIAGVCQARGAAVHLLDVDAVALEAARQNVPEGTTFAGSTLAVVEGHTYDAIVSNPPIHQGKGETRNVLERLISDAPDYLESKGSLTIVVQKRVKAESMLRSNFSDVERLATDPVFNVFSATRP